MRHVCVCVCAGLRSDSCHRHCARTVAQADWTLLTLHMRRRCNSPKNISRGCGRGLVQHVFAHPRAFQVSGFSRKALRFRGRMSTDMAKSHGAWRKASRRVLAARACRSRRVKRSAYTVVKRAVRVWKSQQDSRVTKAGPRASCTFDRVTLYEVCCSSNSATSRKVTQSGGAAVRVLRPPTYVPQFARHLKRDPPSRNVQASLLPQLRQPVAEQKPEKRFLNMDWPVHQMVLLKKIQTVRPAPGTTKVVLLTSPYVVPYVRHTAAHPACQRHLRLGGTWRGDASTAVHAAPASRMDEETTRCRNSRGCHTRAASPIVAKPSEEV